MVPNCLLQLSPAMPVNTKYKLFQSSILISVFGCLFGWFCCCFCLVLIAFCFSFVVLLLLLFVCFVLLFFLDFYITETAAATVQFWLSSDSSQQPLIMEQGSENFRPNTRDGHCSCWVRLADLTLIGQDTLERQHSGQLSCIDFFPTEAEDLRLAGNSHCSDT